MDLFDETGIPLVEILTTDDKRLQRGEATRQRVLDAAERLFAEYGFDGVSIRQIAQEAGVTLGVVGFHGGSKEALFTTLLERRVATLSEARSRGLARLRDRPEPLELRDLIAAYMEPYIRIAAGGDPQWHAYARLIARIADDERWYAQVRDLYDPVARDYLDAIIEIRPHAEREKLVAAFVMAVASMLSIVASTDRIAGLSAPTGKSSRLPERKPLPHYGESLIAFCTGGIEQAIARPSPDKN
jgi:AcrR family transcriptional regulator